jgi:hypothetical protein
MTDLEGNERIYIESLAPAGSIVWQRHEDIPSEVNSIELLRDYVRHAALTRKGSEAWRAKNEADDVLVVYSEFDRWREMTGKEQITMHPIDQAYLALARMELGLSPIH